MAEVLRDWLPDVIQACSPWISSGDIEPGAKWSEDIFQQLAQIQFGICCLTPENVNAPWIHFEAGAVAKELSDKTRVVPYLLGLEPSAVVGPLVLFHAIKAVDKEDTRKLVRAINRSLENEALSDNRLDRAFETNWPRLEKSFKDILDASGVQEVNRDVPSMVEEILNIVRDQSRFLSTRRGSISLPFIDPDYIPSYSDFYSKNMSSSLKNWSELVGLKNRKFEEFVYAELATQWNKKGQVLQSQKMYIEAIQAYDEAIKIDPQYAKAWYNKGITLKSLGRTTEADAAFAKAKELGYEG
jgi:tetratricopeptide (TPR) repeat protein